MKAINTINSINSRVVDILAGGAPQPEAATSLAPYIAPASMLIGLTSMAIYGSVRIARHLDDRRQLHLSETERAAEYAQKAKLNEDRLRYMQERAEAKSGRKEVRRSAKQSASAGLVGSVSVNLANREQRKAQYAADQEAKRLAAQKEAMAQASNKKI